MERRLDLVCLIAMRECQSRSKILGHGIPEAQSTGAGGQWGRTSWGWTSLGQNPWGRTSCSRTSVGQDVVGQNIVGQDVTGAISLGQ